MRYSGSNRFAGNSGRQAGSSFLEIIVVVLILLVITAIFAFASHHLVVRAKFAKSLEDQKQISRALSSYRLDNDKYPQSSATLTALVSPRPYLNVLPTDPFGEKKKNEYLYFHQPFGATSQIQYVIAGVGPDGTLDLAPYLQSGFFQSGTEESGSPGNTGTDPGQSGKTPEQHLKLLMYDPTNGLNSTGDIITYQN